MKSKSHMYRVSADYEPAESGEIVRKHDVVKLLYREPTGESEYILSPALPLNHKIEWSLVRHLEGEFWVPSELLKEALEIPLPPPACAPPYLSHQIHAAALEVPKGLHNPQIMYPQTQAHRSNLFVFDLVRDHTLSTSAGKVLVSLVHYITTLANLLI